MAIQLKFWPPADEFPVPLPYIDDDQGFWHSLPASVLTTIFVWAENEEIIPAIVPVLNIEESYWHVLPRKYKPQIHVLAWPDENPSEVVPPPDPGVARYSKIKIGLGLGL